MRGWHFIEEDLAEEALDDFAAGGVEALEALLAKHARFRAFLKEMGRE